MNDTQKMLQAIIHGQNALKQELVGRIDKVDKKVDNLGEELKRVEKKLTGRIDKLGRQLAYLEDDDAPTREEHNNLEKRVEKLEQNMTSI